MPGCKYWMTKMGFGTTTARAYPAGMITLDQIRAARALLNWSQPDLARAADLKLDQIKNIERGRLDPRSSMMAAIEEAFRQAGVIFLDRDDVRPGGPSVRFLR
jgi:transcriptional regulator with XRE-family HTH domain